MDDAEASQHSQVTLSTSLQNVWAADIFASAIQHGAHHVITAYLYSTHKVKQSRGQVVRSDPRQPLG